MSHHDAPPPREFPPAGLPRDRMDAAVMDWLRDRGVATAGQAVEVLRRILAQPPDTLPPPLSATGLRQTLDALEAHLGPEEAWAHRPDTEGPWPDDMPLGVLPPRRRRDAAAPDSPGSPPTNEDPEDDDE